MAYWLIDRVAHHLSSAAPKLFWRRYVNTPLMPMLRAHADAEVVRMHAVLCGTSLCKACSAAGNKQKACADGRCGKALADGLSLRGLEDLKNHRDVLGHPMTFQLNRPAVRKFVDDKRDVADVRPALVWDIHRSIVDAQIAAAVAGAAVLDVTIGPYQTAVLESILRLCWKPRRSFDRRRRARRMDDGVLEEGPRRVRETPRRPTSPQDEGGACCDLREDEGGVGGQPIAPPLAARAR